LESSVPFSSSEMIEKYRNGGTTIAMGKPRVAYVEGRCLGGGSEINSGLYHRTPDEVLDHWGREYGVADLADMGRFFEQAESDLSVSPLPHAASPASLQLLQGATKLGWRALEVPRWYRYDAEGAGRKQSMTETFLPRARRAGARIEVDTRVLSLEGDRTSWLVSAQATDAKREYRSRSVFVCAGAVHGPALLKRSGIEPRAGSTLRLHPTIKIAALFDKEVNGIRPDVPVHQVREFAPRLSLGGSVSSQPHLHLALIDVPGGNALAALEWRRMAIYYAAVRDGKGSILCVPGVLDPVVRYSIGETGFLNLIDGLKRLSECLLAAGARTLYPSVTPGVALRSMRDVHSLVASLRPAHLNLMTVHLMGSSPMGERTDRCIVDSFGRVHGQSGLYVNDASMLPTSLGVNPQGTIMAFALRNAHAFLGT
jgi:choline dehydrogenase-like flavoprotein